MRPVFFSPPTWPRDEVLRQAAVEESGVLAQGGHPALQAIAEEAAALFATPMSAVSIVDRHRQWFPGQIGLPVSETSRATSFCGHTILTPETPLVVTDAERDERFAGNPLVRGQLGVRFYAGAPLIGWHGFPLGALCVLDNQPREQPDGAMLARLRALAQRAAGIIRMLSIGAEGSAPARHSPPPPTGENRPARPA